MHLAKSVIPEDLFGRENSIPWPEMTNLLVPVVLKVLIIWLIFWLKCLIAQEIAALAVGRTMACMEVKRNGKRCPCEFTSNEILRDSEPLEKRRTFSEPVGPATRSFWNLMFEGLYALAVQEDLHNSLADNVLAIAMSQSLSVSRDSMFAAVFLTVWAPADTN